ncbi:MAG: hypothetical protein KatS3mg093_298 [Candidatus Parcubacteria bacterium]|nr:MAG: hypothetical protein KatS3mg093_298 [Candidatus Parcubacteria bacterium]
MKTKKGEKMKNKEWWCIKHRYSPYEEKVTNWCLRWNCRHLRGKHKKIKKYKTQIFIEIQEEIIFFEENNSNNENQ